VTATYWLRVHPDVWADRDTLQWPAGVTIGPAQDEHTTPLLVRVGDENAPPSLTDAEIEWSVRLRTDNVVELLDRQVAKWPDSGRPAAGHELWTPANRALPFAADEDGPIHAGRQCLDEFAWHAHCDGQPVWLLGGDVNCPECLAWLREEAAP
jgi:hypothetical protein